MSIQGRGSHDVISHHMLDKDDLAGSTGIDL